MAEASSSTVIGRVGVQHVDARGALTADQVARLLGAIHESRVLELDGNSHVSQQDIRAHLIRVFGFGGYDMEVLDASLVFEQSEMRTPKRGGKDYLGWDVCYRALVRLTIRNPHGELVAIYEDGSTATAQAQRSRGDAHDLAYKSAISLSVKRAAIALGDQFGLSLYNKGQRAALVRGTLVPGTGAAPQEGGFDPNAAAAESPQQSLGNDEVDRPLSEDAEHSTRQAPEPTTNEDGEAVDAAYWSRKVDMAASADDLRKVWEGAREEGMLDQALKNAILGRKADLEGAEPPAEAAKGKPAGKRAPAADKPVDEAPANDEGAPAPEGADGGGTE